MSIVAPLQGPVLSLSDITVSTAAALPAFAAGPNGIMVTAHPNNTVVLRVSGPDVSATKGQPLAAGVSAVFNVGNANLLSAIAESGSGTLCVSAV